MTVYFDNAATTAVCPEAVSAAVNAMTENFGNPSSTYFAGRNAASIVNDARESVARAMGAKASEIVFTSGGTEGDNWALRQGAHIGRHWGRHIITSAAEHDAVRQTARRLQEEGWEVTYLSPDKSGRITLDQVENALRDDTVLVSLMLVNNETGAISPIKEIASLVHERVPRAIMHTDAVQAFLKTPFKVKDLGVDLLTVSGHKIHAPKGVGALYIKSGLRLPSLLTGGGQEGGLRPGTEPVPAIAAFGAAAKDGFGHMDENVRHMRELRTMTLDMLRERVPEVVEIGEGDAPQILSVAFPGYGSEVLMNVLDAAGVCVSKSSACRKGARSHVLEAMGLPSPVIDSAIRVSFSRYNTPEEVEYFVETVASALTRLRKRK